MKKIIALAVATATVSLFIPAALSAPASAKEMTKEERRAAFHRVMGGFITDTRKMKGRVVIVNAQQAAEEAWLKSAADTFAKDVQIKVEVEQGAFDLKSPEKRGEATVFVVNDPALPMSLLAPEAKWAVVNIATLKTDKLPFFKSRVERAIVRGIVPLLGGADSQYPMCIMGAVSKPEELDRFIDARLPMDVIERMRKNFASLGLGSWERTTYRNACIQGWAPRPTNDVQQAIWDKVHALPTAPIAIEPEK